MAFSWTPSMSFLCFHNNQQIRGLCAFGSRKYVSHEREASLALGYAIYLSSHPCSKNCSLSPFPKLSTQFEELNAWITTYYSISAWNIQGRNTWAMSCFKIMTRWTAWQWNAELLAWPEILCHGQLFIITSKHARALQREKKTIKYSWKQWSEWYISIYVCTKF